jgi:hypothetical protein
MAADGSDPIMGRLRARPPSIQASMRNMATPAGRAARLLPLPSRLDKKTAISGAALADGQGPPRCARRAPKETRRTLWKAEASFLCMAAVEP